MTNAIRKKNKKMERFYYYYDQSADILYFSQGRPGAKDRSEETSDDIILRFNIKSNKIKGFAILNFTKRPQSKRMPVELPIRAELAPLH